MYLITVYKYSECILIQYLNTMYLNTAQLWVQYAEILSLSSYPDPYGLSNYIHWLCPSLSLHN